IERLKGVKHDLQLEFEKHEKNEIHLENRKIEIRTTIKTMQENNTNGEYLTEYCKTCPYLQEKKMKINDQVLSFQNKLNEINDELKLIREMKLQVEEKLKDVDVNLSRLEKQKKSIEFELERMIVKHENARERIVQEWRQIERLKHEQVKKLEKMKYVLNSLEMLIEKDKQLRKKKAQHVMILKELEKDSGIFSLEQDLAGIQARSTEILKILEDLSPKRETLEKKIDRIEGQTEIKSREIEKLEALEKRLNRELQETEQKIAHVLQKKEQIQSVIHDHDENIKELYIQQNNIDLVGARQDLSRLLSKITNVQNEIKKLQAKMSKIELEIAKNTTRLQDHLIPKEREIYSSVLNAINTNTKLKMEINELRNHLKSIKVELEQERQSEQEIISELSELERAQKEQQDLISRMQENEKSMEKQLTQLKIKIEELTGKSYHLRHKMNELQQAITEHSRQEQGIALIPPEQIKQKINELKNLRLERRSLEPVNMKSIEQYETLREKYNDYIQKEEELLDEREKILKFMDEIEKEKRNVFMKTFNEVNNNFSWIYRELSNGGTARLVLLDEEDPFSELSGVNIEANPAGKKIKDLRLASGGEKSLITLAFIFAIQQFKPAPFYIFDEIDAALDDSNARNVSKLISKFSETGHSQFIVISLRDATMVNADQLIGVTNVDGISSTLALNLNEIAPKIKT
ncbi:MAG: coiled-coil domain-containing protein, partial [Candidatus Helarchaeales archaeon]